MRNKGFYFLLALLCLAVTPMVNAQKTERPYDFKEHASRILKEFDIILNEPAQFTSLLNGPKATAEYFYIRQGEKQFWMYNPVFQSVDKDCMALVGIPWRYMKKEREMAKMAHQLNQKFHGRDSVGEFKEYSNDRIPRDQIRKELNTALQLPLKEQMDSLFRFHFDEYVTVVTGKMPREMFNADTLFFYDIPLDVPYRDNYTHCLGMISAKKDMASVFFKLFFTDTGKEKQNDYVKQLNKAIWYKKDEKVE